MRPSYNKHNQNIKILIYRDGSIKTSYQPLTRDDNGSGLGRVGTNPRLTRQPLDLPRQVRPANQTIYLLQIHASWLTSDEASRRWVGATVPSTFYFYIVYDYINNYISTFTFWLTLSVWRPEPERAGSDRRCHEVARTISAPGRLLSERVMNELILHLNERFWDCAGMVLQGLKDLSSYSYQEGASFFWEIVT